MDVSTRIELTPSEGRPAESAAVSCTLSDSDAASQLDEWIALLSQRLLTVRIPAGIRMTFPIAFAEQVRDLADREAACCSFLNLTVQPTASSVTLEITSANSGGLDLIERLARLSRS